MKRIEFIAPVAAMRGNLSGKQDLKYALNDNPASDAPDGENAARNYEPRFVGAKIARNGVCYFSVKTRHIAVKNSNTMVVMGINASIAQMKSDLMRNHATENLQLTALYAQAKAAGYEGSRNKWFYDHCFAALRSKLQTIDFVVGETTLSFKNPYFIAPNEMTELELIVKPETFLKYASYLSFTETSEGGVFAILDDGENKHKIYAPYIDGTGHVFNWLSVVAWSKINASYGSTMLIDDDGEYVMWGQMGAQRYIAYQDETAVNVSDAVQATTYVLIAEP